MTIRKSDGQKKHTVQMPELDKVELLDVVHEDRQFSSLHRRYLHLHRDRLELYYIHDGSGSYQVGRRDYAVEVGDLVVCNQGVLHGALPYPSFALHTYCLQVTGVEVPGLPPNNIISHEKRQMVSLKEYRNLINDMMMKTHEIISRNSEDREVAREMAKSIVAMVVQEIKRQETTDAGHIQQKTETLLRNITEYLDNHYMEEDLRMEDICKYFHISESYLSHAFKRETRLSPKQYIILRRIGEAQTILEKENVPVREVVERVGFGSNVHLSSVFRKYVGMSPTDYRSYYRGKQENN